MLAKHCPLLLVTHCRALVQLCRLQGTDRQSSHLLRLFFSPQTLFPTSIFFNIRYDEPYPRWHRRTIWLPPDSLWVSDCLIVPLRLRYRYLKLYAIAITHQHILPAYLPATSRSVSVNVCPCLGSGVTAAGILSDRNTVPLQMTKLPLVKRPFLVR